MQTITSLGYTITQEIGRTEKHSYLKLEKEGQEFFAKIALENNDGINQEIWFSKLINDANLASVRSQKIVEQGDNWYIAEFISGELLSSDWQETPNLSETIEAMAEMLVELDHFGQTLKPISNKPQLNDYKEKMVDWAKQPIEKGILTQENLDKSLAIVERSWPDLEFSLQHGDFVPWHIFKNNSQNILIDAEHAGLNKPRFYDLAYCYTRISTRYKNKELASKLLESFLAKFENKDLFHKQFPGVMAQRAIGMHFDVLQDANKVDYVKEAQNLLDSLLKETYE